jgi:predicted nucleotidyltransferase
LKRERKFKYFFKKLIDNYKPEKIILFGSYARGDVNEASDIDLVIIKSDVPDNFLRRLDEIMEYNDGSISIDFLVYKPEEIREMLKRKNRFIATILKEGTIIYEKK